MRKITSKHVDNKKQKRKGLIVGGVLIFIMLFSVLGSGLYLFGDENESRTIKYQGYEFFENGGLFYFELGDYQFALQNNPNELPEIGGEINPINNYENQPLYFFSENENVGWIIPANLNAVVQRMQDACYEECEEDYPVKTCEDNFIIVREGETNKIEQIDNCVFIEGDLDKLGELSDVFLLKVLGIN
jgi:hypothetical protein